MSVSFRPRCARGDVIESLDATMMPSRTERLEEEVDFWERFIHDWWQDRHEPVPWRAYQALMLARKRLQQALDAEALGSRLGGIHGTGRPGDQ